MQEIADVRLVLVQHINKLPLRKAAPVDFGRLPAGWRP
jgi:hypothetical protein